MPAFLLWNVHQKPLDDLVVRLVQQHKVHVLLLIEPPEPDDTLLGALQGVARYTRIESHKRFGIYTRYNASAFHRLTPPVRSERMDFWRVRPSRAATEVLLVVVHGLDRVNYL